MLGKGAIAAGHRITVDAAAAILEAGGNAFDAALAALCAACVAEPVLTSLGGGGFLNARTADGKTRLYDFFVQTPRQKRPTGELSFYPILADFGTAKQEFHIGMGAVATPGTVRGLFDIHRQLASLPMPLIAEPAIDAARTGVRLNDLQATIFSVVAPIYLANAEAREVYESTNSAGRLWAAGETMRQPALADALESLAREGDRLFYEGEMARSLIELCRSEGGQITMDDLRGYRTTQRRPLELAYRQTRLHLNPPPSSGGLLIAFALALLQHQDLSQLSHGDSRYLTLLGEVMDHTNQARAQGPLDDQLLSPEIIDRYRAMLRRHPLVSRGTTHISIVDHLGNAASLTLSNGEGCGHLLPGTGIMINNMLGEEDLNPNGFHQWPENVRLSSMMAPTIAEDGPHLIALGSGGSNRLRTAILQTLCNLIDFGLPAVEAVAAPRLHVERELASIEPGFSEAALTALTAAWPKHHLWDSQSLFFGGCHTVIKDTKGFTGAGDPRRGGVFRVVA